MQLISFKEVRAMTGLSRTTVFRYEKAGNFPQRRKLSERAVRWVKEEVEEWIASQQVVAE